MDEAEFLAHKDDEQWYQEQACEVMGSEGGVITAVAESTNFEEPYYLVRDLETGEQRVYRHQVLECTGKLQ